MTAHLLGDALERPEQQLPRAVARLRLVEARLGAGGVAGAQREVERLPFEPVSCADLPAALVPRLERIQGLGRA